MNGLEARIRSTLEEHAGGLDVRRMPPGTTGRVRRNQIRVVLGFTVAVVVAVSAGAVLLTSLPRGSGGRPADRSAIAGPDNVPPGWPAVHSTDPDLAYLPRIDDPDLTDGPVVLASGRVEGSRFTVFGYTLGQGRTSSACLGFVGFAPRQAPTNVARMTTTCTDVSPRVPEERDVSLFGTASPDRPDLVANLGFMSKRVDRLYVSGGENLGMFEIRALPALRHWDVVPFFFVPASDAGPFEVDAAMPGGTVMPLAHGEICRPPSSECRSVVVQDLPVDGPIDVPVALADGAWPKVTRGGDFEPYIDHEANAEGAVDPGVIGEKTVIAYGTVQSAPWSLVAYDTRYEGAPHGVSPAADLFVTGVGGSGGSLYNSDPWMPNDLSAGRMWGPDVGFDSINGIVSPRVATVRLEFVDGTTHELELIDGPEGVDARYFVEFIPSGGTGRLVAFDVEGNEVEQMCLRDMLGVPPGGNPCS